MSFIMYKSFYTTKNVFHQSETRIQFTDVTRLQYSVPTSQADTVCLIQQIIKEGDQLFLLPSGHALILSRQILHESLHIRF